MDIKFSKTKDNRIQGGGDSRTLCCDVFRLRWRTSYCVTTITKAVSRSNVKKHELVSGEFCLQSLLLLLRKN